MWCFHCLFIIAVLMSFSVFPFSFGDATPPPSHVHPLTWRMGGESQSLEAELSVVPASSSPWKQRPSLSPLQSRPSLSPLQSRPSLSPLQSLTALVMIASTVATLQRHPHFENPSHVLIRQEYISYDLYICEVQ